MFFNRATYFCNTAKTITNIILKLYTYIIIFISLLFCAPTSAQDSIATSIIPTVSKDSLVQVLQASVHTQLAYIDSVAQIKVQASKDSLQQAIKSDGIAAATTQKLLENNIIAQPKASSENSIETARAVDNDNFDFFLFIIILAIPAVFRFVNPSYFNNILVAYKKPNISARQLKDQLSQNSLASMVMDSFFCLVLSLFSYAILSKQFNIADLLFGTSRWLFFLIIVAFWALLYFFKKIFLQLLGFLFKSEEAFETFTFNIFLLNRVMAFVLMPLVALLLFGPANWQQPVLLISVLVIVFFFIQRYIRSAATFNYLFKYSKFLFFIYLCASEVMPILILAKALSDFLKL